MRNLSRRLSAVVFGVAVTAAAAAQAELKTEVFTAEGAGFHVTSTLVLGDKEAILIDAQFTLSEAHRLSAKILETGKSLKRIFVTHGHPDHYFGLEVLTRSFPQAVVVAKPEVVEHIKATFQQYVDTWGPLYGSNITKDPVIPQAFEGDFLELEGERLELIDMEPGEIESSTVVHIPTLSVLIAGDVVYNGVHVWMAEADAERRANWLNNLTRLESYSAKTVIAGHKVPGKDNSPASLASTAQYIKDFEAALAQSQNAEQLVARMKVNYSELALPVILDIAAKAAMSSKD